MGNATVVLADPNLLLPNVSLVQHVDWVQSTWAGNERLLSACPAAPWILTRVAGVFGPAMAEYVIGAILCRERHFPTYYSQQ